MKIVPQISNLLPKWPLFSYIITLFIALQFILPKNVNAQRVPEATKGTINLNGHNLHESGQLPLEGEWEFYWNRLLEPSDFSRITDTIAPIYISVPGSWNDNEIGGRKIPAHGYATYRLLVQFDTHKTVYLKIDDVSAAYKIWVNGAFIAEVGKLGTSKNSYKPITFPKTFTIEPDRTGNSNNSGTFEIIIQIANFHHRNSGLWTAPTFYSFEEIGQRTKKSYFYNSLILGILLIMGLYHFGLYFLRRKEVSTLFFGFFALTMAIRGATTGNRLIMEAFPDINFFLLMRLEYLSAYTNIIFAAWFFYSLFKAEFQKRAIQVITISGIIITIIITVTPIVFFTKLRDAFNLFALLSGLYIVFYALLKAVIRKKQAAILAFAGMFIMVGTGILDIVTTVAQLQLPYFAPTGLVFYIFVQAFIISQRFSLAFTENEKLSAEMNVQNKNLEFVVEIRTKEINNQKNDLKEKIDRLLSTEEELVQNNEELQALNEHIDEQKTSLEKDAIKLKGQAALAEILKNSTDSLLNIAEFADKALHIILSLPWLDVVSKGSIFVTNSNGDLEMVAEKDLGILTQMCAIIKPGQCLCGRALLEKKTQFCNHISHKHEVTYDGIQEHGHYNIPLMMNDRVLGVLNIYVSHKHVKNEEEQALLETIANTLASVIHRKTLQEKLETQAEELQKYYISIEQSPITIVFTDTRGIIQYANPEFANLTGYSIEEAMGKNPRILKSGKTSKETIANLWKTIKSGNTWEGEFINLKKNGDEFIEKAVISPVKNSKGEIISYIALKEDITELKKAEQIIKRQSEQQQILIDHLPAHIYFKNTDFEYLLVNESYANLLGFDKKEIINKSDYDFISKTRADQFNEVDKRILETCEPVLDYETKLTNKSGKIQWASNSKVPYLGSDRQIAGIIGIVQDITERKLQDQKILTLLDNTQKQKMLIEDAHKKITDSIDYAQTIQDSLLPNADVRNSLFHEHFILFKPKEAVSGDFYYTNKVGDTVIFAAADCTGHGVPGAFMTIISITFLDEIIRHNKELAPGEILNKLRTHIIDIFAQFGNDNKNGLDIALCTLNTKTNILQYAGAFNPLIIIRNHKLLEYKATKAPIGLYPKMRNFETTEIQMYDNDVIYMFSDGYQDQFGGIKNRKFSKKRLKELLIDYHHLPLNKQKDILEDAFTNWQKNEDQIDDIVVFGVKLKC